MQKIHILPQTEAQKIAAGEVVERPANIVKELFENSIDAGADTVTIHIEKSGKKRISISDNGCGMSPEDAQRCFARHATSKLSSVHDLVHIQSFGFRGEALASISAVAHVTLTTKPQDAAPDTLGTQVVYRDGVQVSVEDVAHHAGTTIEIADLFETLPVRKAFLKQDETEWNAIQNVIWGLVLTYPNITCKVYKDGKLALNAIGVTQIRDRIGQVWNHNMAENMSAVVPTQTAQKHGISVTGMISQPSFWRYGRDRMLFFVNNRLVKNNEISKAIVKGYKNVLPPGRFPAVCLFLEITGESVDVNIHPRKEEVRFTRPGIISREVEKIITATLEDMVSNRLEQRATPEQPAPTFNAFTPQTPTRPTHKAPEQNEPTTTEVTVAEKEIAPLPKARIFDILTPPVKQKPVQPQKSAGPATPSPQEQEQASLELERTPTIIGQLFATYIIIQSGNELILVDQHAAHERILYHEFAHTFEKKEGTSLLFPEQVTLAPEDVHRVLTHDHFFADQGIGIVQSGENQISITHTPPRIQKESLADLIHQMVATIKEHEHLDEEPFTRALNEHMHSHMACKAAVKAGDVLDHAQMKGLVEKLLKTPNRFICVHGRPTMWPIDKKDIEKKFRRI